MRITAAVLAGVMLANATATAYDFPRLGIFRKKTPKEEAPQRVKQLVEMLKTDPDEKKRQTAAEELAGQDPRKEPDVIPTLVSALQKDPSATVRAEVAESIGKLKPVAQQAGLALEQTLTADPSDDVRKAAKEALWQYHLNGYRSTGANPAYPQTPEPPIAKPKAAQAVQAMKPAPLPTAVSAKQATPAPTPSVTPRPITTGIGRGAIYPQTVEPPLAKPKETVSVPVPAVAAPPLPKPDGKPEVPPSFAPPKPDAKSDVTPTFVPPPPPGLAAPAAPVIPTAPAAPTFAPPPMK